MDGNVLGDLIAGIARMRGQHEDLSASLGASLILEKSLESSLFEEDLRAQLSSRDTGESLPHVIAALEEKLDDLLKQEKIPGATLLTEIREHKDEVIRVFTNLHEELEKSEEGSHQATLDRLVKFQEKITTSRKAALMLGHDEQVIVFNHLMTIKVKPLIKERRNKVKLDKQNKENIEYNERIDREKEENKGKAKLPNDEFFNKLKNLSPALPLNMSRSWDNFDQEEY